MKGGASESIRLKDGVINMDSGGGVRGWSTSQAEVRLGSHPEGRRRCIGRGPVGTAV